ncbi:hypothetical protein ACJX0J_000203, partial [Zea mays]
MLTNRLRKIGSDFAVLFSAVPRRDMSSLGFRNSNFHIDLGHYMSSESNLLERRSFSPYETFKFFDFKIQRLIVLWQLYKSFSRTFSLYESILFQFLPETSQENPELDPKIDGINIYILLVIELSIHSAISRAQLDALSPFNPLSEIRVALWRAHSIYDFAFMD